MMVVHKPSSLEIAIVDLPSEIVTALAPFAPLFSDAAWAKAQVLAIGAILTNGRRTVASALRVTGRGDQPDFTNYHRLLNRDAWSCLQAGRILLGLVLAVLPMDAPLVLAVDDTVERRNGRKIKAKGCYRDAVRSSKKHPVKCFGLKWTTLSVLLPMPWGGRVWALPLLTALCPPAGKGPRPEGERAHKTTIDWARQLALRVRRWAPGRRIVLVADGGFASVALAAACRRHDIALVCRLKINAALYDNPIDPPPGRRGRKPKKGARQPSPAGRAACPEAEWAEVEVTWYRGRPKVMKVLTGFGLWDAPRVDPVPLNYLVARDPEGTHRDAAYFCTDGKLPPAVVLGYVVQRWSLEVSFEEMRAYLGMETQRQWSDLAIARTTPVLMGLYSLVCLLAMRWHAEGLLKPEGSAWYAKSEPTFSDCLTLTRRRIWENQKRPGSGDVGNPLELPDLLWKAVIQCLSRAA